AFAPGHQLDELLHSQSDQLRLLDHNGALGALPPLAETKLAEHLTGAPDAGHELLSCGGEDAGSHNPRIHQVEVIRGVIVIVDDLTGCKSLTPAELGQKLLAAPDHVHEGGALAVHGKNKFMPGHRQPPRANRAARSLPQPRWTHRAVARA